MTRTVPHERIRATGRDPDATLIVLHGFLGSGRNWRSFAGRLIEWRPDWAVDVVDLRLHGDFRDVPGPHHLLAAAGDLADHCSGPTAMLGHSLGGKVAILAATEVLDPPPIQTWVVDSTPFSSPGGGAAARMLTLLEESPPRFAGRNEAVDFVQAAGFDGSTATWMATNLVEIDAGFAWNLDVEGLRSLYEDFLRLDLEERLAALDAGHDLHFVWASRNSAIRPADLERLDELSSRGAPLSLHRLDGGHWLHVDNPDGLLELVAGNLPRV